MFIILSLGFCLTTTNLFAQQKTNFKTVSSASTCETVKYNLDYAVINNNKIEGATLLLIFRLGKGESSTKLTKLRMIGFESYIKLRDPNHKYIMAESARNEGLGKIEIYVGGKLEGELFMKKNKSGWDSCIE